MSVVSIHFFPAGSRINPNVITPSTYNKGSANLTPDSNNLVNKLWVKGGKAVSEAACPQAITVSTEPIPLYYTPRSPVTVTVGTASKTLGIQNLDATGTFDFLLNASEKLLIPDQCTSGNGTIEYNYEYPIKILMDESTSQLQYGIFEDILQVDTDDKDTALDLGYRHLFKFSQPVVSGSIEPFAGTYKPGECILVQIPDLNIDQYLEIKEVTYTSVPGQGRVETKLQLESPERDVAKVLKDLGARIANLEKATQQDDDGPVEYYIAKDEAWGWLETATLPTPIESTNWWQWAEQSDRIPAIAQDEELYWAEGLAVTQYSLFPADDLYPSTTLYPM